MTKELVHIACPQGIHGRLYLFRTLRRLVRATEVASHTGHLHETKLQYTRKHDHQLVVPAYAPDFLPQGSLKHSHTQPRAYPLYATQLLFSPCCAFRK